MGGNIFNNKSAYEKYEDKIEKASPPKARAWIDAGEKSLMMPLPVSLPYAEAGYLPGQTADATSFAFMVKPGQKISIRLNEEQSDFTAYMELWEADTGDDPRLVQTADTTMNIIEQVSLTESRYIFRLHPELGAKGNYNLQLNVGPALGFPIESKVRSNIGSFWGDGRDGGSRRHEGIDIFANKGSYAVASTDGIVTNVNETPVGGKVVWLRPHNLPFTIYYAHLDAQFVSEGQQVKKGDPIGTVGNTGNAKHTPAHLHYGIYTYAGAIDPLHFVKKNLDEASVPRTDFSRFNTLYEGNKNTRLYPTNNSKSQQVKLSQPLKFKIDAATQGYYRVVLDNGAKAFVPQNGLPKAVGKLA